MIGNILINGIDIAAAFGVLLDKGGLEKFELPPKRKEVFFNDWKDQNGLDYDESAPIVYESQIFDVPFIIHGNGIQDYHKKKNDFLELININGEFDFQIVNWGHAFKLRYKEIPSWGLLNKSKHSKMYANFVLRLENNFNKGYAFRYLADNLGRRIVINGSQEILVKTTY